MSNPEFNPNSHRTRVNPEDLPPLEPTADVPAIHSDKLNDPEYWNQKHQGKTAKVPREHRDDKHETTSLGWKKPTAALALLGAVAAGAFGVNKLSDKNDTSPPKAEATVSASTNQGDSSEAENKEPATYDFGISAAEYENNPEALGKKFYEIYNSFLATGATEKQATSDDRLKMGDIEYSRYISQDVDQAFTDDVFVQNWEDDPELAAYVNNLIEIGHITRHGRLATYPVGTEEDIPYERQYIVDNVGGSTNPLITNINWHGYDNRNENSVEEVIIVDHDINNDTGGDTITWVEENGQLKISSIDYYTG